MLKPVEVKIANKYRIFIRYTDGVEGEVDLSHLVGKGVFKIWDNYDNFRNVKIGEHGEISWSNEVDICSDSLYLQLTNKDPEEIFPKLKTQVNA